VQRILPTIKQLDRQIVPEVIQFDLPSAVQRALPPVSGPYGDDTRPTALSFVKRFFQFYDNARDQLLNVYDPQAYFSLQITTLMPRHLMHQRQQQHGASARDVAMKEFGPYIKLSRNMMRNTDLGTAFAVLLAVYVADQV